VELLCYLFVVRAIPAFLRSDKGPELASRAVRKWVTHAGVETLCVAPGSPRENGHAESCNERLRDELLNRELFLHMAELRYVVERRRMGYNPCRPHRSPGYMNPAALAAGCVGPGSATLHQSQHNEDVRHPLIEAGT
jgi:transposase InsO family protein